MGEEVSIYIIGAKSIVSLEGDSNRVEDEIVVEWVCEWDELRQDGCDSIELIGDGV